MKIQLNAADFSKQLDFAIKAVAKNGIIPELECFLLQADAHRVTITATNLETQIRTECVALCEGDFAAFSVTVIARTFCDAIKALGAQNITLNFGGEPLQIAFNATYLHEITGVFDGDEIHFSLTDARKAALIETVGGAADEAFFVVLMPVMINVD